MSEGWTEVVKSKQLKSRQIFRKPGKKREGRKHITTKETKITKANNNSTSFTETAWAKSAAEREL
jgi:hypothetical protein